MNGQAKAVEINGLTVKFGGFTAVDNISFSVDKGEIFGFLGANGAGKTTTIRVLCGLLIPTSGAVKIAGAGFESGKNAIKTKVGYMSQKFTLYNDLTVSENLAFKAALRKIPEDVFQRRTKELLDFIGFTYPAATMVKNLPSGVKQQLSLAASLLHDPEIIFLDEPTSGVSPAVRAKFWSLIKQLAAAGKTVIVTTHYMDEAEQCQRIALMRTGKVIALGSPQYLESSAYPEPLLEISAQGTSAQKNMTEFSANPSIIKLWPHGMKLHAIMRDKDTCSAFVKSLPEGFSARVIKPSLEDVFIRLVEGKENE